MATPTKLSLIAAVAIALLLILASPTGGADVRATEAGARAAGRTYPFVLEARNASCREPQDFRFEPQNVPWLKLPQGNVARQVAQGETRALPAVLDFTNTAPGQYTGRIDVVCDTCGWFVFRSCYIDRQTVLLSVDVTPAVGLAPGTTTIQDKPKFSCCEKDIHVTKVGTKPGETQQTEKSFTIEFQVQLEIELECTILAKKECLAYYEVSLKSSDWEERKDGEWVKIDDPNVSESFVPDPNSKLKWPCDGKKRSGVWTFDVFVEFLTKNPVRSTRLVFNLDVPAGKGQSYEAEFEVSGSGKTGDKPAAVKLKELKKKSK